MKKLSTFFYGALLTLMFSPLWSTGQDIFFEGFDSGMPANFTLVNNDGLTPSGNVSYVTDAWIVREDFINDPTDSVAISTSWYTPAGTADDWMITPAITLGDDTRLSWEAFAPDATYPDGYQVFVGTTNSITDFMNAGPVLTVAAENSTNTPREIDISSFDNQTEYIAFRNNSTDQFILILDDIRVFESPAIDIAIDEGGAISDVYTEVPLLMNPSADFFVDVENNGVSTTTFESSVQVTQNGNIVYSNTDLSTILNPGDSVIVDLGSFTFIDSGDVSINYSIVAVGVDSDLSNNTLDIDGRISLDRLVKDDGVLTGTLGIGNGTGGLLGNEFSANADTKLKAVEYIIDPNGAGTMSGQWTKAFIYSMGATEPDAVIGQTDSMMINGPGPHVVQLPVLGDAIQVGESFGIFVQETDSNTVLAYSDEIFTPGTGWVFFNAAWGNNEDFGFEVTYQLRAILTDVNIGINEQQLTARPSFEMMPNPVKDVLTITSENLASDGALVTVYNSLGQQVYQEQFDNNVNQIRVNTAPWSSGAYTVAIRTGGVVYNQKVVK